MGPDFDLAVVLTYYAPYVSGLTETARVVAEDLAAKGCRVRVVTSQHDASLPKREVINGVDVVRTPVAIRVGKGVVSPSFPVVARDTARRAGLVNLHLPMLEAGLITRLAGTVPIVSTYHCDIALPGSRFDRLQTGAIDGSARRSMRASSAVVASSEDYARSSRLWSQMRDRLHVIPPPCRDRTGGQPSWRDGPGLHVGFLGRIVEEKGLEFLVDGFARLDDPDARLLIGGDYSNVAGGSVVERVRARVGNDPRIRLLGFIPDDDLANFYASLDVFALPSVNSFEAFGIVQVEAMMCGVPALVSDIPGIRTPVQRTGFGLIVPPRDAQAIADGLAKLHADSPDRHRGAANARELFGTDAAVLAYGSLFESMQRVTRAG